MERITDLPDDILYEIALNVDNVSDLTRFMSSSNYMKDSLLDITETISSSFKWAIVVAYSSKELREGGSFLYSKVYVGDKVTELDEVDNNLLSRLEIPFTIPFTMAVIKGCGGLTSNRLIKSGDIANVSLKFNITLDKIVDFRVNLGNNSNLLGRRVYTDDMEVNYSHRITDSSTCRMEIPPEVTYTTYNEHNEHDEYDERSEHDEYDERSEHDEYDERSEHDEYNYGF